MTNRVPPGVHPNWCRCQGCRRDIARFEAQQFKGTLAFAAVVIALGGIVWLIAEIARHLH